MRVGIDASNLRGGGGLTHLAALLNAADPLRDGFSQITVWGGEKAIECVPQGRKWLKGVHIKELDSNLLERLLWRRFSMPAMMDEHSDVVLIPSGLPGYTKRPWVTMCRNMLPFEHKERKRYGVGPGRLRLELLRMAQGKSFETASGVIFLTDYARETVISGLRRAPQRMATIPHGVDRRFVIEGSARRGISECSLADPFRILYVSTVNMYKHQWNVTEAVGRLRREGVPLALDLVGGGYPPAVSRLKESLRNWDPSGNHLRYHGSIPFSVLHERYKAADAFVFASSCENMPNILLEAMAARLPIASSTYGPMPEMLGDDAFYFDPEDPKSIKSAIFDLVNDQDRSSDKVERLATRAKTLTWELSASRTFDFLRKIRQSSG